MKTIDVIDWVVRGITLIGGTGLITYAIIVS